MGESVFERMRRTVSARLENAVDAMERTSGPALMRQSIREIDQAIGDLAADQDRALNRAAQAERRWKLLTKELGTLAENAQFALTKQRPDLARAALSRQMDMEAEIAALKTAVVEARDEAQQRVEAQASLRAQHQEMSEELVKFEQMQRAAPHAGAGDPEANRAVEAKVRHAKDAFDRVMKASSGVGMRESAPTDHMKVMEIRELERAEALEARFAALSAGGAKPAAPAKPMKKSAAKGKSAKK